MTYQSNVNQKMLKVAEKMRRYFDRDKRPLTDEVKLDRIQEAWDKYVEAAKPVPGQPALCTDAEGKVQFGMIMPSGKIVTMQGNEVEPIWAVPVEPMMQFLFDVGAILQG